MNREYIENNRVAISFFTMFSVVVSYLHYTHQFIAYERPVLFSISAYEGLNIVIEIRNHLRRKEPQIVLYLLHHVTTAGMCGMFVYYYQPTSVFHDLALCTTYNMMPNLYLNAQYAFPNVLLLKILFAASFVYYRIALTFPYFVHILLGSYLNKEMPILSVIGTICPLCFFGLNMYWGRLIVKKAQNKIKAYLD